MNTLLDILNNELFLGLVVVPLVGSVVAGVAKLARQVYKNLTRSLDATELATLDAIARIAVRFAEQKFAQSDGPARLAAALAAANTMLAAKGIKVTAEQLLLIVESAVYAETAQAPFPEEPFLQGHSEL